MFRGAVSGIPTRVALRIVYSSQEIDPDHQMRRPLVIDVGKDLPARASPLSPAALAQVFGGVCFPQGHACMAASGVVRWPYGLAIMYLCSFYRGRGGFVAGYCTRSSIAHGS